MRGYDAGKKVKAGGPARRKRHIAVDTLGLLLCVVVHSARISDTRGVRLVLLRLRRLFGGRLEAIFVEGGYQKSCILWTATMFRWTLTVVKRLGDGFKVLPKRWVVERTFAWLCAYRLNAKDYHHNPRHAKTALYATAAHLMLQRLHPR